MIRINLLPYVHVRKKEKAKSQILIFIVFVILLLAGLLWYQSNLNGKIEDLNARIDFTKKELDRYNKIVAKVEEIRKQLEILRQKLEVIKTLNASRESSYRLMDTLTRMVIEKKMWLTQFEAIEKITVITKGKGKQAEREEKVEVNIAVRGIALDSKTVADFMTRLEEAAFNLAGDETGGINLFSDVRLVTLEQEKFRQSQAQPEINLMRFQITFQQTPIKLADSETDEKPEARKG